MEKFRVVLGKKLYFVLAAAMNQRTHFHVETNIVADLQLMVESIKDYRANILPARLLGYRAKM